MQVNAARNDTAVDSEALTLTGADFVCIQASIGVMRMGGKCGINRRSKTEPYKIRNKQAALSQYCARSCERTQG